MGLVRRLLVGILSLLVIASGLFFATPAQAQSASTYEYAVSTSCNNSVNGNLAIRQETPATQGGTLTYIWCYTPNTTYTFTLTGSNDTITVTGTNPGQGTMSASGQASTVTITNESLFTQTFPAAQQQANQSESCESIGSWAWMACPIVNMMSSAMGWLDKQIQGFLEVGEDRYTHPQLRAAWVNFRNIAYVILIPIMLVMVIGTALGFEVFSAYTVKKALPRMVIATIFITLSWYITTFLIGFFNVMGAGVIGLMTSPFGMDNGMSLNTLFGASTANTGDMASTAVSATTQWATLGVLGGGLTLFAMSDGGLVILLLTLAPMVLMVLTGFLVLLLRELFILGGVLVAPLAILAWIFPGNDKLWKSWWGLFSKLLIMFPLIMVIIGAGRITAWMINTPVGGGGAQALVNPLLKLAAYVLPYMLIPLTFRYAGGVFANLAGIVNDREKGLFDRLRKKRGEHMKEYAHRGANQGIYDRNRAANTKGFRGWRMRATNTLGGWAFDPVNSTRIALGTEKGRAVLAQINRGKLEDSQKLSEVLSRMGFNAEELSALSLGRNIKIKTVDANGNDIIVNKWIDSWNGTSEDLDRIAKQLSSSTDQQDRIGGRHLQTNAQLLTQVVRSEEYGRADFKIATGLAYAAQGFATPEEIARLASEADGYTFKSQETDVFDDNGNQVFIVDDSGKRVAAKKVVKVIDKTPEEPSGLGGIVKTNAELLSARAGGLGKPGYGVRLDDNGTYYAPTGIDGAKIEQVVRTGVQDFSAAKGSQLSTQLGDALNHIMTASSDTKWKTASGEVKEIGDIRTGVEQTLIQVMGSYAAPDVKRRVYEILVKGKASRLIPNGQENDPVAVATARAEAEAQIQALLNRSSGNLTIQELNQMQQAAQQDDQNRP